MSFDVVKVSKFLSLVLRHKPEEIGIVLDEQGWVGVEELLEKMAGKGLRVTREELRVVVEANDKKRFALSEDGRRIRASQGHSVEVELGLEPRVPPEVLYHGTATRFLAEIRETGLVRMSRRHVHLSKDEETAVRVGGRHGKVVVLKVRSGEMSRAGYLFWCSENGVWLCEAVPVGFVEFPS